MRLVKNLKSLIGKQAEIRTHHYLREENGNKARLHLRIDPDGHGTLIVNANRVVHFNPSAALMANLALESMDFVGVTLHMLAFCLGGILFYYLLDKSRVVPRALSLWGLITVFPCLVGTLAAIFGYEAPFIIYVPYVPFEFVIGVWILVKGIQES